MPNDRPGSLWRHADFLRYWLSQTLSRSGVQIATLALPLAAIYLLDASPGQLGILNAAVFAPYLLVSLLAGVWIDRCRKRNLLIGADLGRVLALSAVPLLALFGVLEIHHLYVIAFAMGVFAVFFDVSGTAYLPTLVGREQLLDGNSKLQASIVVTQSGGPALAGVFVQFLGAPITLVISAVTSLTSVASMLTIRNREEKPPVPEQRQRALAEIWESLRFIAKDRYLRFLTVRSGVNNLFFTARNTVLPLFVLQVLGLNSAILGLILGVGALGALLGATIAKPMAQRLGPGRVIVGAYGISSLAQILLPAAHGPASLVLAMLLPMFFVGGLFMTVGNTNVATLQQMLIPQEKLGKVVAGMRTVTWGSMPLGALLGGSLGSVLGVREALIVTAVGFCLSALWIALSPIAKLRSFPESPPQDTTAVPTKESPKSTTTEES
ncbi:MFS transporter [Lipingzhangella sp. LS1_29]|uniref:MFS transporter n=1 Tax=Lipingzhangella rawalii TaxID=2055835 RepID=A0ABU2H9J2_9ACTN|nr:MFS transporter [Lipingzhangella rawalii]